MSNVLQFRRGGVDEALVAHLETMLASARRGQARSSFGVFQMDDGSVQVFSRGAFAGNPNHAAKVASEAIDLFCYQQRIAHPKVAVYSAPSHGNGRSR